MSVAYRLWLPLSINRVVNLTKLRSVIYDQSVNSSCFVLFEASSAQFRSKRDPEAPECSNNCQIFERCILFVGNLIEQESAQYNKFKERSIRSICRKQIFCSLRAHQHSSDQKNILKDQNAQITALELWEFHIPCGYPYWLTKCSP